MEENSKNQIPGRNRPMGNAGWPVQSQGSMSGMGGDQSGLSTFSRPKMGNKMGSLPGSYPVGPSSR